MDSVLLIIYGVWLAILSAGFFWFLSFFKKLVKGTQEDNLFKVLNRILKIQMKNSEDLSLVQKEINRLEKEGCLHVQKVSVIRFNPFAEIGGDHSFALALLDGENSGAILTCLHARERTRIYLKAIKKGKCNQALSDEEKKVLVQNERSNQ